MKAMLYVNYSKLTTATDTVRRMRETMGPLTPESALSPAVAHIAETTARLATACRGKGDGSQNSVKGEDIKAKDERRRQRETVRWVLNTPNRLEALMKAGDKNKAYDDWTEIQGLLGKWNAVRGVEEVRLASERIMAVT